jgi:pimeloyl-ACP methyl ester carboxylesterase
MDGMATLTQRYIEGDATGAVHGFFALLGPDWRTVMDRALPGGIEQAEKDASTFFEIDLAEGAQWSFGPEQAAAISCPVLSVLGTASGPLFAAGRAQLHEWFPQCQNADITGATHYLKWRHPPQSPRPSRRSCGNQDADGVSVHTLPRTKTLTR